jgi:N-acetyltransferase
MIDFKKEYVLENERVKLIPLQSTDIHHLVGYATQEPELWTYALSVANTPERMATYIENAIAGRLNENTYPFIVLDKRSNQYAGSTRLYDIQIENASTQLGYTWYGKQFQGSGINKNCKYLLLEFAFDILKMERVEFRADNENTRSINAMKSIGCQVEGVLRSNAYKPCGTRRNSIVLSILKPDWNLKIREELQSEISKIEI